MACQSVPAGACCSASVVSFACLYTQSQPLPTLSPSHTPQTAVDVVLGDTAVLSRQHARITYNFNTKKWQLVVEVSSSSSSSNSCSSSSSSNVTYRQPLHSHSQDAGRGLADARQQDVWSVVRSAVGAQGNRAASVRLHGAAGSCGCVSEWGEGSKAYPESLIEHYGRPRHTRSQQSTKDPLMVCVCGGGGGSNLDRVTRVS